MSDIRSDASEIEKKMAHLMRDRHIPKEDILKGIRDLPASEKFVMRDTWIELVLDDSLENWRRLASYKLLIHRCITYPCSTEYFLTEAIMPLGIARSQVLDMTRAQTVPIARENVEAVFMAILPISTSVGPAAVYFAERRSANQVEQAVIYPDIDEAIA